MLIRAFADDDLSAVHTVQLQCPHAAQWREEDYLRLAGIPGGMILIAQVATAGPPEVVGFAAFHRVSDEAELHNLAVNPAHRRRGAARALLQEGIRKLREAGARRVFLEVRASNHAAVGLYASAGFTLHATRRGYYQNPVEDALVMALDVIPASKIPSR